MSLRFLIALSWLSEEQREAFVDHVLLGRSLNMIARDMGVGPSRAAKEYHRAVFDLRAMLVSKEQLREPGFDTAVLMLEEAAK